jgi:hypothetical protein
MPQVNIYPKNKEYENLLKLFPIQSANKFLPNWYKEMKIGSEKENNINAKNCPAIQDLITTGFVIPLWSNLRFETINEDDNTITHNWFMSATGLGNGSNMDEWISKHDFGQTIGMDYGKLAEGSTLKINCPYVIEVPDGYSIYYYDPFYHFRKDIRCLSGIVDNDKFGEVNFPFEILKDNFYIEAGTPLIHCIVFKRDNEKLEIINNEFSQENFEKSQLKRDELVVSRTHYKDLKN